jgi:predicted TIM-barrel fold metal-dependent hydrolase
MYEGKGRWASNLVKLTANPAGMSDPRARLPDMDAEGIDLAVLYGTTIAFHASSTYDWRFSQALCRAWNDWAAEYCAANPERLKFAALVPLGDATAAAEEGERAVREGGAVGITFLPNHMGRSLDQTYFDPVYAAAQRLDVPICVHGNTGSSKFSQAIGAHDNWLITHALAFPMGLIHALASVVCGGVLERFPTLRVAFLEGGCGWLPFFMDRFDEHVEKLPALAPWLSKPPSEHIRGGQVFITCEPEEDLAYPLSRLGEDVIMYASDYAHWDSEFPDSARKIAERPELTEGQKAKILRENAARFYRLPVPAAV